MAAAHLVTSQESARVYSACELRLPRSTCQAFYSLLLFSFPGGTQPLCGPETSLWRGRGL